MEINNMQESLITELAFRLITDSEESEGFCYNLTYIDASGASSIAKISKKVILEFLDNECTKVSLHTEDRGIFSSSYLLASNSISKESIKIYGLKDHYHRQMDEF